LKTTKDKNIETMIEIGQLWNKTNEYTKQEKKTIKATATNIKVNIEKINR
jgi:diadenosine tetraphosphate (Ap4A) HIT family hydrolase